jgi:tetratricopeptide (TPR) repeat protein/mono/diheme cytochrome c family protein
MTAPRQLQRFGRLTWLVSGAVVWAMLSGSNAAAQTQGGGAVAARRNVPSSITFTKHIAPLLFERCASCHRPGGAAPFGLLDYAAVRQRATQIAAVTKSRLMPPWKSEPGYGEFLGQQALSDAEIELIRHWVDDGAPEGDRRDLPSPPQFPEGWQLGEPDLIVTPSQAYMLDAAGADAFRVFVLPIPIGAARYVRGVEFRPGHSQVIHHANILLDRTPRSRELNAQDPTLGEQGLLAASAAYPAGHFLGWTPGQPDRLLPKGLSWRLEPGTDLVVQLHMLPSGKPETVEFSVGFYFGTDRPEQTPGVLRLGHQDIDIAAGTHDYTSNDSYVLPVDVEVLAVKPHAHFRARQVRGYATLPDGSTRWLLYIKDWDFRWQHVYRYRTPVVLPKGSTIHTEYVYDNSADNPHNPQLPPQRVRWGPRSADEMGDLWLQVLARDDGELSVLNRGFRRKLLDDDARGYEGLIERDSRNVVLHDDVALLYLQLGRMTEAVAHYEASVKLQPESAVAHFNLGAALMLVNRNQPALSEFQQALRLDPDYAAAHNNLGNLLDRQGQLDEALVHYREALRLNPASAAAHNNIGFVMTRRGSLDLAVSHFRDALRIDPGSADAHYNLGIALQRLGTLREAVDEWRAALQIKPDWPAPLADLAWTLATAADATIRDPGAAITLAERAAALTGRRDGEVLDVLAAAYAAHGQFARAAETIREAISVATAAGMPGMPEMIDRQRLYQQGRPYQPPAPPR